MTLDEPVEDLTLKGQTVFMHDIEICRVRSTHGLNLLPACIGKLI